jgi:hypothetical protein
LESESKGPDRLYINKQDRKDYEKLLDKDSPFKDNENKDVFIMAMTFGFAEGIRTKLEKKEGFIRVEYLNPSERALIAAIAVAEKGNLSVLADKKEEYAIAEEFAAGGVRLLKDKVFSGEYGSYSKRLEDELLRAYEKMLKPESPKRRGAKATKTRSVIDLVKNGESTTVEFKSSLIWDYELKRTNKLIGAIVARTASCFMNSEGGVVLVGVDNDGNILGLANDLSQLDGSLDNFELHFTNVVNTYLGKIARPYVNVEFEEIEGRYVALIKVKKSPRPAYIKCEGKTEFYIRSGNSCQPLDISDANIYIKDHWPDLR